ncbi:MAG: DUF1566 domain-containing protein [Deltaproteobacteria bacterium]|nr:DUF1566 domain-containing protein [Deltaproteobacteria bacterium]
MRRAAKIFLAILIVSALAACTGHPPRLETLPEGTPRYSLTDYGSILDRAAGLEWFVGPDSKTFVADAQRFVQQLRAGGHDDWRLPTIGELRSIREKGAGPKNLPAPFTTRGDMIWSDRHNLFGYGYLRLVNGSVGYDTRARRKHGFRVFAVRELSRH